MKNVRVEYSAEITVNTGNFQNVKPGYRVSATVEDHESPNQVRDKLKKNVEAWLAQDVDEIRADLNG